MSNQDIKIPHRTDKQEYFIIATNQIVMKMSEPFYHYKIFDIYRISNENFNKREKWHTNSGYRGIWFTNTWLILVKRNGDLQITYKIDLSNDVSQQIQIIGICIDAIPNILDI